jgi:CRP/FNR family cyclic AMP-dependent transcriptional regulator
VDSAASGSNPELGETALGVRRDFERVATAGETIFEPGDPADAFYVILAGEVQLVDASEGAARLIARLGPGDSVGETDSLLGRARTARAIAATDARLLRLDRDVFLAMCLERPDIALQVMERLAQRAADLERRLEALGMNDLLRPVARGLLRCAVATSDASGVPGARANTTLRGLAAASGLSLRESHRGLQELFDRKLVRLVDDALVVADRRALEACLETADDAEATGSGLPA